MRNLRLTAPKTNEEMRPDKVKGDPRWPPRTMMAALVERDAEHDGDGEEKREIDRVLPLEAEEHGGRYRDAAPRYAGHEGYCLGNADDEGEAEGDAASLPARVDPLRKEHEQRDGDQGKDRDVGRAELVLDDVLEKHAEHGRGYRADGYLQKQGSGAMRRWPPDGSRRGRRSRAAAHRRRGGRGASRSGASRRR